MFQRSSFKKDPSLLAFPITGNFSAGDAGVCKRIMCVCVCVKDLRKTVPA